MNSIFSYTDYQTYLRDWLSERKKAGLSCSNRWFAEQVGVRSSSYLTSLLKGIRRLSRKSAARVSGIIGHSPVEKSYFEAMVRYAGARNSEDANRWFSEMEKVRGSDVHVAGGPEHAYYREWYHSVVRSLVGMYAFTEADYGRIANMVSPPITPSRARRSIELLLKLGLVDRDRNGTFRIADTSLTTGAYVRSHTIHGYQQRTLQLALGALERYSREEQDISTLTLGVPASLIPELKNMIADFRGKVIDRVRAQATADCVYQMNIQLFPSSEIPAKTERTND